MGDFSKIDAPHKYGSRIGMAFSDSFRACRVPLRAIEEIEDVIVERQNIRFCFTDGCGQISPWLARRVWRCVQRRAARLDLDLSGVPTPSAYCTARLVYRRAKAAAKRRLKPPSEKQPK